MDTLTHAILGATVARATAPSVVHPAAVSLRSRTWLGGIAAAFPDIDYLLYPVDSLSYLSDWHRAETHSLVMLPLWALLLGLMMSLAGRHRPHWREYAVICALGLLSHILSDLITSWGTEIFAPLSTYRASLGTTFIIDPYFTLILLTGLMVAVWRASRPAAQASLALLVIYVGLQAVLKLQAHEIARTEAQRYRWPQTDIYTMPQPFSPFHWKIIIREEERYHMALLDLIANDHKPTADPDPDSLLDIIAYYRPRTQLQWRHYHRYGQGETRAPARAAWRQPVFERYRRFAWFPLLTHVEQSVEQGDDQHCFWFRDLRFEIPLRQPPFVYGVCRARTQPDGWQVRKFEPPQRIAEKSLDYLLNPVD